MPLALLALALLALVLLVPVVLNAFRVHRRRRPRLRPPRTRDGVAVLDPGRERRAEQRARELLRSCVNEEEWAMYRELGFIRVFGRGGARLRGGGGAPPEDRRYAYLVYPHK